MGNLINVIELIFLLVLLLICYFILVKLKNSTSSNKPNIMGDSEANVMILLFLSRQTINIASCENSIGSVVSYLFRKLYAETTDDRLKRLCMEDELKVRRIILYYIQNGVGRCE